MAAFDGRGLVERITSADLTSLDEAFSLLKDLLAVSAVSSTRDEGRDLTIRMLERRTFIHEECSPILNALLREHGLFPYVNVGERYSDVSFADAIAYEYHKPNVPIGANLVMHSEQAHVYRMLLAGENVVLSAPTSFGKSLLIDAVIAARRFAVSVVVVPTIALIDETRRRLSRLGTDFRVLTDTSQRRGAFNVYVLTQERFLAANMTEGIDFFVIDEFYKLDAQEDGGRYEILNEAVRRLLASGAQYYMLGPNVAAITTALSENFHANFVRTTFTTVATDVRNEVVSTGRVRQRFVEVMPELDGQTMIYCQSPRRARDVALWLMEAELVGESSRRLEAAADWVADTYHPEWRVARALRAGIGIHHGRMPRALAHHIVRLFNEGLLRYLVVTSTLIEGVNTSAKNVVVVDNKIGSTKYDAFTHRNILGRAGRMFEHYVGRVLLLSRPPEETEEVTVDLPSLSQSSKATTGMLLQVPYEDLSEDSQALVYDYYAQDLISVDTLRSNVGFSPEIQMRVAHMIDEDPQTWRAALHWPNYYPYGWQMRQVCDLLFLFVEAQEGVTSPRQLATRIGIARQYSGEFKQMFESQLAFSNSADIDEAVESVLRFTRNVLTFSVPRGLRAVQRLANDVFRRAGLNDVNVEGFTAELEHLFQERYVSQLEEYGVPAVLTQRLARFFENTDGTLDEVLEALRYSREDVGALDLGTFEKEMLLDALDGLGVGP